jgi:hypothetical protein
MKRGMNCPDLGRGKKGEIEIRFPLPIPYLKSLSQRLILSIPAVFTSYLQKVLPLAPSQGGGANHAQNIFNISKPFPSWRSMSRFLAGARGGFSTGARGGSWVQSFKVQSRHYEQSAAIC